MLETNKNISDEESKLLISDTDVEKLQPLLLSCTKIALVRDIRGSISTRYLICSINKYNKIAQVILQRSSNAVGIGDLYKIGNKYNIAIIPTTYVFITSQRSIFDIEVCRSVPKLMICSKNHIGETY